MADFLVVEMAGDDAYRPATTGQNGIGHRAHQALDDIGASSEV